ncbi:cytoplasmic protein [Streptomyces agglomeratus]|uniref:STM4015 family protein n=1 Tax=Streptomyces agglomeratus TaxID=285458 RepID=UPI00086B9D93|nr:STM4015 family protein [Streptomyces agglomeratus]OEJ61807.1 cytoplasmic protein [Streptomyces agglomeratus]
MTDIEHPETFHGLPVLTLPEPGEQHAPPLPPADSVAWRLDCLWNEDNPFAELWPRFLDSVDSSRVRALLIGPWWHGEYEHLGPVLDRILADADRFPALRGLFLADVISEECELSWLEMTDVTPCLEAFPRLEELVVRGCGESLSDTDTLSLRPVAHDALKVLRFESGGLPGSVVRAVGASRLPALERLELWLGVTHYGGDATVADLAPLLSGGALPRLRQLGVQNSEIQDEIATAVAAAPVVARLDTLALSMGTLTDVGAHALLEGQPLTHLGELDLHHHYITEPVQQRLRTTLEPHGVRLHLDEPDHWDPEYDETRYVAVDE